MIGSVGHVARLLIVRTHHTMKIEPCGFTRKYGCTIDYFEMATAHRDDIQRVLIKKFENKIYYLS